MEATIVVCTVISTICIVKPWRAWRWLKRLYRHVLGILEQRRNRDDELEIWQVPEIPGYFFKSKDLYE